MKKQIKKLSSHQNGKVLGILMAVTSLFFLLPMALVFSLVDNGGQFGLSGFILLLFPFMYLILGYISVAIGCFIYNLFFKYIGGIEFEETDIKSE